MTGPRGFDGWGVVRRLRRIRVLVVSQDQALLRTAADRLRREGFPVEAVRRQAPSREDVLRSRPDVVLLDHAGSLGLTLRAIAAVESCAPHVAVVVAGENVERPGGLSLPSVPRASSGRRLAEALERAYLQRRRDGEVPADAV